MVNNANMNLLYRVKKFIQTHTLIARGDTILVGVSGGADSIVLARILTELRHELGFQLHIAHFNHQLRQSSARDQKFVEQFANELHLPFTSGTWKGSKSPRNGSLENLARQKRLTFLIDVAKKTKAQSIALAHNQNDLAETILMRMIRGAGLQGSRGILAKRTLYGKTFIRPLLETPRIEIERYLKSNRLKFQTDPTNTQTKFFRNKIRLHLLPTLQKNYNPNIVKVLSNLATNVTIDYDYLEKQTKKILKSIATYSKQNKSIKINTLKLLNQHPAIQHMIFRKCIERVKEDVLSFDLTHIQAIDDLIKNRPMRFEVHLPTSITIKKLSTRILINKK